MHEILDKIISDIALIKLALEAKTSSYNFVWMLARYTVGVPKLLSDYQIQYDKDLSENENFQVIYTIVTEDIVTVDVNLREFDMWNSDIQFIPMFLLPITLLLLEMMTANSIFAVAALLPLYPALAPYLLVIHVLSLAFLVLTLINSYDISNLEYTYCDLIKVKYNNDSNLFFKPSNENSNMPKVLEAINESFTQQEFKI
jgi:hypothetical protein